MYATSDQGALALSQSWGNKRSFWTKRKKTATSLLTVLALVAGIAVAFKLFDQTVPNNVVRDASVFDYTIEKLDERVDDTNWEIADDTNPIFEGPFNCDAEGKCQDDIFPGDSRSVDVRITNTNDPARHASFEMYFQNIQVYNGIDPANPVLIPTTDARWNRFVNFFTFEATKQLYLYENATPVVERDLAETRFGAACEGGLKTFTDRSPCQLGVVEANGSETAVDGARTDQRHYEFTLSEADDGTNQSAFKGWYIQYDMVFNARVPALPERTAIVGEG